MIQSSLSRHLGGSDDIVSLVSIAYVSKNDPAYKKPSKPVGPVSRFGIFAISGQGFCTDQGKVLIIEFLICNPHNGNTLVIINTF
jgi:hypothetical protein